MQVRTVVVLEEAAVDLETGRAFYEGLETGVGRYFLDCLLIDLESLRFQAGVHSVHFGFHRLLSQRFPFAIYYDVTLSSPVSLPFWTCDGIPLGSEKNWVEEPDQRSNWGKGEARKVSLDKNLR